MAKKTMALAAVLLACGIGTASAQGQMQGQTQGQGSAQAPAAMPQGTPNASVQGQAQGQQGAGQAQAARPPGQRPVARTTPPYREQVPTTVPLETQHITTPKVNPSAAGTVTQGKSASQQNNASGDTREHSGAVGTNANTHPLEALRARGKPRQQGMTEPSGVYPTPRSTMNRGSGQ